MKDEVLQSPLDNRDYTIKQARIKTNIYPPAYSVWQPPIENQGRTGNCVAQSLANIMECIDHKDQLSHKDRSVGYIYGASSLQTPGMYPREACRILLKYGDVYRSQWECLEENPKCQQLRKMVPSNIQHCAKKISMYVRLDSEDELKRFIYKYDLPVLITGKTKDLIPELGGASGSHAVVAFGWDQQGIKYQNSWGTGHWYQPTGQGRIEWNKIREAWGLIPMNRKTRCAAWCTKQARKIQLWTNKFTSLLRR